MITSGKRYLGTNSTVNIQTVFTLSAETCGSISLTQTGLSGLLLYADGNLRRQNY